MQKPSLLSTRDRPAGTDLTKTTGLDAQQTTPGQLIELVQSPRAKNGDLDIKLTYSGMDKISLNVETTMTATNSPHDVEVPLESA